MRIMVIIGTRPEAIKLAPVVGALRDMSVAKVSVCVTAQHRQMLDQVLGHFEIVPEYDLNVMRAGQALCQVAAAVVEGLQPILERGAPHLVLVHGDTATTLASAIAAFYFHIPLAHVEAGLRTGSLLAPWPEEMHRKAVATMATLHFAPTESAKANLLAEGISADQILVTGNTAVDALQQTLKRLDISADSGTQLRSALGLDLKKQIVLVTGHRRENFGPGIIRICRAILTLADRDDVQFVYPVHLNPSIQSPVQRILGSHPNIKLLSPLAYPQFAHLMSESHLILTDSGGIQEEAPSLGKPVLIMRDATERPEAVRHGSATLVGTNEHKIIESVNSLLDDITAYEAMSRAANPFGDGHASVRIAERCVSYLRAVL